jgi:beta-lactamase class A
MSVYKLPLALMALTEVDRGNWRLDHRVPIAEAELRSGKGPVAEAWHHGEKDPSLESLLSAMLVDSDNTAGDKVEAMLTHRPGIAARLDDLGLQGIAITGPEIAREAAVACPGALTPDGGWSLYEISACPRPTADAVAAAVRKEVEAPPDNATTDALVELLGRLRDGSVLTGDSRAWLLGKLEQVRTGPGRIKAGVPAGATVAHKTGTGATVQGVTVALGDVGIVTAPSGDAIAIAVLLAGSHATVEEQEAVIARMTRAACEALLH